MAINKNDAEMVNFLIKNGANPNHISTSTDENEMRSTPLHQAILLGNKNIVQLLITLGARLDYKDSCENYPIHTAVDPLFRKKLGSIEMVQLLLNAGANININTEVEGTPLHRAVSNNDVDMVTFLLENGADVNTHDWRKRTPLEIALYDKNDLLIELLQK